MSYFKSPPFYITVGILILVGAIYFIFRSKYEVNHVNPSEINIVNKWEMPEILHEVSGIAYLSKSQMAAVQDEKGIIYIYNLVTKKIDREIEFGKNGDYEGITMLGNKAYILRSDAYIFEIEDITAKEPVVKEYELPLKGDYDFEGITYDKKFNRLLLAFKDENPEKEKDYKTIFQFDLQQKKLLDEPVYKITYDNPLFKELRNFKTDKVFKPSEIGIHPKTGDIYILDGKSSQLLILDSNWKEKQLYVFDPNVFNQPEGMTFSPEGKIYISNEGGFSPANILHVVFGSSPISAP